VPRGPAIRCHLADKRVPSDLILALDRTSGLLLPNREVEQSARKHDASGEEFRLMLPRTATCVVTIDHDAKPR
jgi:hypothetical protein